MASRIQLRRDSADNWSNTNPTLAEGEAGLDLDSGRFKIGNGIDDWNTLDYALGSDGEGNASVLVQDGSAGAPDVAEYNEGQLWWNSDAEVGKLFVLYEDPADGGGVDAGGLKWIEASPMPITPDIFPDLDDGTNQPGTLDDRYLSIDADAGNQTVASTGTTVFNGHCEFDSGVSTGNAPNFFQDDTHIGGSALRNTRELWESTLTQEQRNQLEAGTLTIPTNVLIPGDGEFARQYWYSKQTPRRQELIDSGELNYPVKLRPDFFNNTFELGVDTNIDFFAATGDAFFNGYVDVTEELYVGSSAEFADGVSANFVNCVTDADSFNYFANAGDYTNLNTAFADRDGTQGVKIFNNGSASFAGGIDSSSSSRNGMQIDFNGGIAVQRSGDTGLAFTVLYRTENTVNITADGSAEFAGNITLDGFDSVTDGGVKLVSGGFIQAKRSSTSNLGAAAVWVGGHATGTSSLNPTSQIFADGSATFNSTVGIGGGSLASKAISASSNTSSEAEPTIRAYNANASGYLFAGGVGGTINAKIGANGNATFNGTVRSDKGYTCYPQDDADYVFATRNAADNTWSAYITGAGSASFAGDIDANNVSFNLEPDNDDNYTVTTEEYEEQEELTPYVPAVEAVYGEPPLITPAVDPVVGPLGNVLVEGTEAIYGEAPLISEAVPAVEATYQTVTKTREIRTYTGPTLDVKERLTKADNALIALKTAAAAATDFASLQTAIATALADI